MIILFVVLLFVILFGYMRFEYRNIKISEIELKSEPLKGIKIIFAADFQFDMSRDAPDGIKADAFQAAVDTLNDQHADLVLLGGDYQTYASNCTAILPYLSQLSAPLGVYGVFGNHDLGVESMLEAALPNIHFLRNQTVHITYCGAVIEICGVEDLWQGKPRVDTGEFVKKADYRILLSHNPDFFETADIKIDPYDLMLAGHIHGGQITFFGLFGFPPVIKHVTDYGERYRYGEKNYNGRRCYITSGLGGNVFRQPIRFGARPEVVVIS